MRTTLTIDEDLAQKLKAEVRRSGRTFKATLCSADADFARFAGLKVENPLR